MHKGAINTIISGGGFWSCLWRNQVCILDNSGSRSNVPGVLICFFDRSEVQWKDFFNRFVMSNIRILDQRGSIACLVRMLHGKLAVNT